MRAHWEQVWQLDMKMSHYQITASGIDIYSFHHISVLVKLPQTEAAMDTKLVYKGDFI